METTEKNKQTEESINEPIYLLTMGILQSLHFVIIEASVGVITRDVNELLLRVK